MEGNFDNDLAIIIEATGFTFWIYDYIVVRGHDVKVVHPTKVKPLMRAKAKNDKNDAFMLAELLRAGCLESIYVPDKDVMDVRDLTRHRKSLVPKRGDPKREIIAALDQHGTKAPSEYRSNFSQKFNEWARSLENMIIDDKLDPFELTMTKINIVENIVEEHYGGDENVKLMTVPGIGLVTVAVIKAEVGNFARFSCPDNLTAEQKQRFLHVKDLDIKIAKAYQFKLAIQRTWELPPQAARRHLQKWIAWAERCNLEEMSKLAKSVRNHLDGLVESVRQRVTSGYAEGLNNKIRTAFRRAYGFKAKKYRDTMIYLVAGGLSLFTQY